MQPPEEAVAIIDLSDGPRRHVRYGTLAEMVDGIARCLAKRVQAGDRVGVLLGTGMDFEDVDNGADRNRLDFATTGAAAHRSCALAAAQTRLGAASRRDGGRRPRGGLFREREGAPREQSASGPPARLAHR